MRDSAVNLCIVLVSVPLLQLAWGQAGPGGAGPGGMGPPTDLPNDLSTEPPVTNMVDMNDNTTDAAVTRIPPVPALANCNETFVKTAIASHNEAIVKTAIANHNEAFADIVFVLDASQSVGDEGFETLKVFVEDVINSFEVGKNKVRVGILKYSDSARTEFNLNDFYNETELNETISKIVYTMGQTNTGNALDHLRTDMFTPENGDRPNVPNVAIIITDGQSTNPNDTIRAAQEARDAGITLFAVGVGDLAEMSELEEIATDPDAEYVFTVTDYSKLDNIAATFQEAVCPITTELITEAPMTTVAEAYCENYTQADIVFVLDSSVSVGSASFEQLKTFVQDRVRVGIMKYSDKAFTEFNLNDSYNQTDLNETIGNIVYVMGITNTGNALDYLRTQMFTAGNGDRADVPNVAVIITDGKSSDPDDTTRAAQAARDAGIILFTVGVGSGAEMSELREVATDPDSTHVFTATDYSALDSIKSTFQQAVCVPPTTGEPCFDVLPRGCRESGVTVCYAYEEWAQMNCAHYCGFCGKPVELPTTTTTTEAPTTQEPTTTPEPEICEQGDIVFVLDSSVSVGSEDFEFLKQFVTALVSDFDVGPDTVRVGVMKYSDNSSTEFNLIDSASDNDLNGTISGIVYEMGITNTGSALDYLRTSMFTPENGDRPNVPNVGIVITDGKSSDPAETVMAARAARDAGIILFAVGVGSKIDVSELDEIATDPDASHVFTATDYSVLDSEVKSTFQEAVFYITCRSGVGGGELVEMSSTVEAPLTTTMEEGSNCTDLSADCKALGYDTCAEYRSWALHYCRRSCDYCSEPFVPEPECCTDQDGWRGCIDKGSGGCTGIYEAWARAHCQAFCGYCEREYRSQAGVCGYCERDANVSIRAKPVSVATVNVSIRAKPVSVATVNVSIRAKPVSVATVNVSIRAKPVSVATVN
ncbi:hypothetical protein BaRGS_00014067, partial [Batillaria attramentaria]